MSDIAWVFEQGGWVSYALAAVSVCLWSAVILRALALRPMALPDDDTPIRGGSPLAQFIREARGLGTAPARLEQLAERTKRQFETMRSLIKTLVAIAPLLGLLGTDIGMVDMFGSMQGALSADGEATVAGGISTALVTTQLGLVIAAPGLIASYMLTRQQLRRERDLDHVRRSLQGQAS